MEEPEVLTAAGVRVPFSCKDLLLSAATSWALKRIEFQDKEVIMSGLESRARVEGIGGFWMGNEEKG